MRKVGVTCSKGSAVQVKPESGALISGCADEKKQQATFSSC